MTESVIYRVPICGCYPGHECNANRIGSHKSISLGDGAIQSISNLPGRHDRIYALGRQDGQVTPIF